MSSYEMRVMPLGRLHRIVTEQLLDGANVGAPREQLDGKRIAEPLRVRVLDSGQRTEARQVAAASSGSGDASSTTIMRLGASKAARTLARQASVSSRAP